jgi:hypothetical protein
MKTEVVAVILSMLCAAFALGFFNARIIYEPDYTFQEAYQMGYDFAKMQYTWDSEMPCPVIDWRLFK